MATDPSPTLGLALALLTTACALPTTLGELPLGGESNTGARETESGTSTSANGSTSASGASTITSSADGEDSGMVGPRPMHAYVMRYDDWLAATEDGEDGDLDGGEVGTATATGSDPTPDALVVQISTGPDSCTDPLAFDHCSGQWQIFMLIPVELQAPGTYDLFSELSASIFVTSEPEPRGDCSGGGGSLSGTATLTAVSEQEVLGIVSPTDTMIFDLDFGVDLELVALGCG